MGATWKPTNAERERKEYWRRLTMASRAGGYYGAAFKGAIGVTQGDLLSPTILMW